MAEEEGRFVRVSPEGRLVLELGGEEHEVELDGLEMPQPPSRAYVEIANRLSRISRPLRLDVRSVSADGRIRGRLRVWGWQDKSGDVWVDLAHVLLERGLARVASTEFREREEYLRHELPPHESENAT